MRSTISDIRKIRLLESVVREIIEEQQTVAPPPKEKVLEGLSQFLSFSLDDKYYEKPYTYEHGAGNEEAQEQGPGTYYLHGDAGISYQYEGWQYGAEALDFSRRVTYEEGSGGSYLQPPDPDEFEILEAEWEDDHIDITLDPVDPNKESEVDYYQFSRQELGDKIVQLFNKYFEREVG